MDSAASVLSHFFESGSYPAVHSLATTLSSLSPSPEMWSWIWDIIKLYFVTGLLFYSTRSYKKLHSISSLSEIVFYFLTFAFCLPFIAGGLLVNYVARSLISGYLWLSGSHTELMMGNDSFWAYDEYANSCSFINLLVMKGVCDLPAIRYRIFHNVVNRVVNNEKVYGKLRKRSVKKFGYYCWEEINDDQFDIRNHVRFLLEDSPEVPLTEDQVFTEIQKIIDHPLPSEHPQWQLLLVPHYVYNDPARHADGSTYFGLIVRMHHSFMDGISGGSIIQNAFADAPPKLAVDPLRPIHIPWTLKLASYISVLVLGPRAFFRTFLLDETNCFHGKQLVGPKTLSWSRQINLDALKVIRTKTRTTTTAIFAAAIGTALRNLALKKGLPCPKMVHGFQTVALLPYPNLKPHNRFAVALLPMHIGLNSSLERLNSAYKSYRELEQAPDILLSFFTMKFAGLLPRIATKFLSDLAHATILITNVPGPSESCNLFNGCELMELSAWAPIRCRLGTSAGFFSYNGRVRACVSGDAACFTDSSDVATVIQEFEKEITELGHLAGLSPADIFVRH